MNTIKGKLLKIPTLFNLWNFLEFLFDKSQSFLKKGSKVYTKDSEQDFGIYSVQAIKPTGAGDAFNGGFVSSLYQGFSLEDAVKRGSANAAIVVTKVGCSSAMPNIEELNQFIKNKEDI